MPWTIDEVDQFNAGLTDEQKEEWVSVANSVYNECMNDGGDDDECAQRAITVANDQVGKGVKKIDGSYTDLRGWASKQIPFDIYPLGDETHGKRRVESERDLPLAVRWATLAQESHGVKAISHKSEFTLPREQAFVAEIRKFVPSSVPDERPEICFVCATPTPIDVARGQTLVGPVGKEFNDHYLKPLGLSRDQVMITNLVPVLLQSDEGDIREPTQTEIEYWADWVRKEIKEAYLLAIYPCVIDLL